MAQATDAQVRAAVVKTLIRFNQEGKKLSGSFTGRNGNVILTVCHHSEEAFSIWYVCYSKSWSWIIPKSEIYDDISPTTES